MHPVLRFVRRRLERGVPYGLGFTVAFAAVALAVWGFVNILDAVTDGDDIARFDAVAHGLIYDAFGGTPGLGVAVTWFGNNATLVAFVVVVAAALVIARRYWAAFRVVFASGIGGLVIVGLKALFARQRPEAQVIEATGYSFPSGHAFASTVFYGMMVYLVWRLTDKMWARVLATIVGPLMAIAVGLSRVYLNVHFLTDVLAGWLAGGAWLVASLLLIDIVETRSRSRRERVEETARPEDADPQPHGAAAEAG
jgi:undecaprenyl-diphosphatase